MFKRAIVTVNGLMIGLDTLTISKKVATVCQEFFFCSFLFLLLMKAQISVWKFIFDEDIYYTAKWYDTDFNSERIVAGSGPKKEQILKHKFIFSTVLFSARSSILPAFFLRKVVTFSLLLLIIKFYFLFFANLPGKLLIINDGYICRWECHRAFPSYSSHNVWTSNPARARDSREKNWRNSDW